MTTTVQSHYKTLKKSVVTTNDGLFSCFGSRCAEPTNFTFQHQSILPCRISPTRKASGSNPPGRTKSSTLWGAALFVLRGFYGAAKEIVLRGFYGAAKERIRTARAPRFASRGAETPSGAFLGRGLTNPPGRTKSSTL